MAARKTSGGRRYGKSASKRVASAMRRRKKGTLKSGRSRRKVTSREQAIAIGLSEAREKGAKVPRKRSAKKGGAKRGGRKAAAKKGGRTAAAKKRSRSTAAKKRGGRKSTARRK